MKLILAAASMALAACVPSAEPLPTASSILVRHNEATVIAQTLDTPFYGLNRQTHDALRGNTGRFSALCDPQFNRRKFEVYSTTVSRMRQTVGNTEDAVIFKDTDIATLKQIETEAAFFCRVVPAPTGHHHHSRPRRST